MAREVAEAAGSLAQALDRAVQLLAKSPRLAQRQAEEILSVVPDEPRARLVLGMALRRAGEPAKARDALQALVREQPASAQTHYELGEALAVLGQTAEAVTAFKRATELKPNHPGAWRGLADSLSFLGDAQGADRAYAEMIRASVTDPRLMEAAAALCDDELAAAERLLRDHLKAHSTDVAAMRMLAEAGTRMGRYGDVEALLDRCLELAPGFEAARYNQAVVLFRQQKGAAAIGHLRQLLAIEPRSPRYRSLLASCLGLVGDYQQAADIYRELLDETPGNPQTWLNLGHALRTSGRRHEAVDAYRQAAALAPALGDAWWSLANLKTLPFSESEESQMEAQIARSDLPGEDRLHLFYALGKAAEDRSDFAIAFDRYAAGAHLRREALPYAAAGAREDMLRTKGLFTREFLEARRNWGCPAEDPIFVVGLPRSGSTLIEQILASHSQVEGTMELPDMTAMARELGWAGRKGRGMRYPEVLADLAPEDFARLGEAYLDRTRVHRKTGRPLFIDKMPGNFHHLGLIRLTLPRARIIDARRHPMAAGFSAFKQHFARGHAFSYDLADIGAYYRDYVELMAHFDAVDPGGVVRVIYEDMVGDTEGQVRRLLERLGLPFEDACLRFWETDRAVRTASSEQVRRPIFREGLDQWRQFEPWLGPLTENLGPALESWRD
ncbi:MAG TPA: sulfotransferase [Caulobacteraceae bacterium]|jgi:tetratricopeptide (TPR) repeat protein